MRGFVYFVFGHARSLCHRHGLKAQSGSEFSRRQSKPKFNICRRERVYIFALWYKCEFCQPVAAVTNMPVGGVVVDKVIAVETLR